MRRASRYATVGHADVLMRAVEIWERAAATIPLLERVVDLLKDLRAGLPISSEELVHGNMGKEGAETVDVAGMSANQRKLARPNVFKVRARASAPAQTQGASRRLTPPRSLSL